MEGKINVLHSRMLTAELRSLLSQGKKDGVIHEKDLQALLHGVPMTEQNWQALYQHLEKENIRRIPADQEGSLFFPGLRELEASFSRDEGAMAYLRELQEHHIDRCLTLEEEALLGSRIAGETVSEDQTVSAPQEGGNPEELLVEGNLLRVVSVARGCLGLGMIGLDLFSEGNRALQDAVKTWNPDLGYPITLYLIASIRRGLYRALETCERHPRRTPEAMVTAPNLPEELRSLGEDLPEEERLEKIRSILLENLENMTPREAEVLKLRFGLTDGKIHTLEETAEVFGVTRQRIRQIENKFVRRSGRIHRADRIRDFYN